jgi:hypothetical protein
MSDDGSSEMMLHPCQTVWTVGQLDNGDVISGGSDGKVRIWTREESRYAAADVREVSMGTTTPVQDADDQAYEERVSEGMKNYRPSIGGAAQTGQTEPITIDIDIRYVPLRLVRIKLTKSDDAPPIPLIFNPGGMSISRTFPADK